MKKDMRAVMMSEETAKKLFQENESMHQWLIENFGEKLFIDKDEKCKTITLDEAYTAVGWNKPNNVSEIPSELHPLLLKMVDLMAMNEYANEGKRPLFANTNQPKRYPYFNVSAGGLVFDDSYCLNFHAYAGDASRLRLESDKRARALGNNPEYIKIVRDMLDL